MPTRKIAENERKRNNSLKVNVILFKHVRATSSRRHIRFYNDELKLRFFSFSERNKMTFIAFKMNFKGNNFTIRVLRERVYTRARIRCIQIFSAVFRVLQKTSK